MAFISYRLIKSPTISLLYALKTQLINFKIDCLIIIFLLFLNDCFFFYFFLFLCQGKIFTFWVKVCSGMLILLLLVDSILFLRGGEGGNSGLVGFVLDNTEFGLSTQHFRQQLSKTMYLYVVLYD